MLYTLYCTTEVNASWPQRATPGHSNKKSPVKKFRGSIRDEKLKFKLYSKGMEISIWGGLKESYWFLIWGTGCIL